MTALLIALAALCAAAAGGAAVAVARGRRRRRWFRAAHMLVRSELMDSELSALHPRPGPPRRQGVFVCLRVLGPHRTEYVMDPDMGIVFGRDASASDVFVDDPTASARHCRIGLTQQGVAVCDLGSANGTLLRRGLNGRRLRGESALLQSGDRLCVGAARFGVELFYYDDDLM